MIKIKAQVNKNVYRPSTDDPPLVKAVATANMTQTTMSSIAARLIVKIPEATKKKYFSYEEILSKDKNRVVLL
jgi:hypothetical protein